MQGEEIELETDDFWMKVVDMLQHNWAVIREEKHGKVVIHFLDDSDQFFDKIEAGSVEEAKQALKINGFGLYSEDIEAQGFISEPSGSFKIEERIVNPIYSSGRFWLWHY